MFRGTAFLLVLNILPAAAWAQRDPPLYESCLTSTALVHRDQDLVLELRYRKYGGPREHKEHQMYVLAFLKKDEGKVLQIAMNPKYLDKHNKDAPLFLDVLREQKLVVELDSKTARKPDPDRPREAGRLGADEHSFPFEFKFPENQLIEAARRLPGFAGGDAPFRHGEDFGLLVFVPGNDCKYATKVTAEGGQGAGDYGVAFDHRLESYSPGGTFRTPILLLKVLPYDLHVNKSGNDKLSVHVN